MPRKLNIRTYGLLCALCLFLSACAGPPALQLLSLAIDGISYLATDKTIADHGLSTLAGKDCKMLRTLQGTEICQDEDDEIDEELLETALIPEEDPLPKEP